MGTHKFAVWMLLLILCVGAEAQIPSAKKIPIEVYDWDHPYAYDGKKEYYDLVKRSGDQLICTKRGELSRQSPDDGKIHSSMPPPGLVKIMSWKELSPGDRAKWFPEKMPAAPLPSPTDRAKWFPEKMPGIPPPPLPVADADTRLLVSEFKVDKVGENVWLLTWTVKNITSQSFYNITGSVVWPPDLKKEPKTSASTDQLLPSASLSMSVHIGSNPLADATILIFELYTLPPESADRISVGIPFKIMAGPKLVAPQKEK